MKFHRPWRFTGLPEDTVRLMATYADPCSETGRAARIALECREQEKKAREWRDIILPNHRVRRGLQVRDGGWAAVRWCLVTHVSPSWTDRQILDFTAQFVEWGPVYDHVGPGEVYYEYPVVRRSRNYVLVKQYGGRNV